MRRFLPLVTLVLPGLLAAQADGPENSAKAAAHANNEFCWNLYRATVRGEDNHFLSPYSVATALAMVRAGAKGNTATEMDAVLRTGNLNADSHRLLAKALVPPQIAQGWGEHAKTTPAYQLSLANALWGQEGFAFEDRFLGVLAGRFDAPLRAVDFRDAQAARAAINSWVAERTHQRIQDIVPPDLPRPQTRLAIANAIYFKAAWADEFLASATRPAPFTRLDGQQMRVPLMHRVDEYEYASTDDLQILRIPYGGDALSMLVVLPKTADGLPALEAELESRTFAAWRQQLRSTRVQLDLPRWKFTTTASLAEVLPGLGIKDAFSPQDADFSAMTQREALFLGPVLHKAFVAVDEKGTEAAAATIALAEARAAIRPKEPIPFRADHPFLFVIQHDETGCILFAGRVTEPEVAHP